MRSVNASPNRAGREEVEVELFGRQPSSEGAKPRRPPHEDTRATARNLATRVIAAVLVRSSPQPLLSARHRSRFCSLVIGDYPAAQIPTAQWRAPVACSLRSQVLPAARGGKAAFRSGRLRRFAPQSRAGRRSGTRSAVPFAAKPCPRFYGSVPATTERNKYFHIDCPPDVVVHQLSSPSRRHPAEPARQPSQLWQRDSSRPLVWPASA